MGPKPNMPINKYSLVLNIFFAHDFFEEKRGEKLLSFVLAFYISVLDNSCFFV